MFKRLATYLWRHHLALLALFLVLGGTSYAAVNALPKNSVGSKQVINGSLQTLDLSKKARAALKGNRGPRGFTGAPGAQGAQGAKGATGAQGAKGTTGAQGPSGATNVKVRRVDVSVAATSVDVGTAVCQPGERATGGGAFLNGVFSTGTGANSGLTVRSYPSTGGEGAALEGDTPTSWTVRMYNPTGTAKTMQVYAVCAAP
jgi:hypothetical protein